MIGKPKSVLKLFDSLVNHGFLPRDCRHLTQDLVINASGDGFNVAPELLFLAARLASSMMPLFLVVIFLGDNLHFNKTICQTLANSNPGVDFFNVTSAGQVQKRQLANSEATNPKNIRHIGAKSHELAYHKKATRWLPWLLHKQAINISKEFGIRTGYTNVEKQSALYLSIMGDPITGVAPEEFVNIFFREERMPIEEGWKRPNVSITRATIAPITAIISQASEWSPYPNQTPSLTLVTDSERKLRLGQHFTVVNLEVERVDGSIIHPTSRQLFWSKYETDR
ncbi:hypothetical protein C8J56DRAFT_1082928 [Mycena floridula]|nr:hypothetical protein C8J56DRAFT_1082928 [Mycena floridula]